MCCMSVISRKVKILLVGWFIYKKKLKIINDFTEIFDHFMATSIYFV